MSRANTIEAKRKRSLAKAARKALAAKRIPFLGNMVTRKMVLGQRYLRRHGLPHSARVADVHIGRHPENESLWSRMVRACNTVSNLAKASFAKGTATAA